MGKNYVESSLKRFLKRKVKITMGFVVAFMIMGTGVFAENNYYANNTNGDVELTKDDIKLDENGEVSIKVNTSVSAENNNRYTALGAEAGKKLTLTTNRKINIVNDSIVTNPERLYGITLNGGANANITANEINFNITGANQSVRGIRNNGGKTLTINGSITGEFSNKSNDLVGIDVWYGGEVTVKGNTNLSLESSEGRIIGVQNFSNNGKKVEFNGDFKTTLIKGENNHQHFQGVLGYQSTTNFNGNTEIIMINDSNSNELASSSNGLSAQQNHIIDIQCDPGNAYNTEINFNGDRTKLSLISTGASKDVNVGVRASGKGPGSVNFNGKEVTIEINSKNSNNVMALASQYGANIISKADNKMILNVKNEVDNEHSNTYGIYSSQYAGYNGNVTLNGSVDIRVEANNGYAYGIANIAPKAKSDEDGKILIGGDLKILAVSKGEATGVFVNGKNAVTTINGNTIIEAIGNETTTAITAYEKGKINITGENKKVQITGDILATKGGEITANVSTADSFLKGAITDNNGNNAGTVNITMDNGAKWDNTGDSSVTNLTVGNNSIVNSENKIGISKALTNAGTINLSNGASMNLATGSTLVNEDAGTINVASGATAITGAGKAENRGLINLADTDNSDKKVSKLLDGTATLTNKGTIALQDKTGTMTDEEWNNLLKELSAQGFTNTGMIVDSTGKTIFSGGTTITDSTVGDIVSGDAQDNGAIKVEGNTTITGSTSQEGTETTTDTLKDITVNVEGNLTLKQETVTSGTGAGVVMEDVTMNVSSGNSVTATGEGHKLSGSVVLNGNSSIVVGDGKDASDSLTLSGAVSQGATTETEKATIKVESDGTLNLVDATVNVAINSDATGQTGAVTSKGETSIKDITVKSLDITGASEEVNITTIDGNVNIGTITVGDSTDTKGEKTNILVLSADTVLGTPSSTRARLFRAPAGTSTNTIKIGGENGQLALELGENGKNALGNSSGIGIIGTSTDKNNKDLLIKTAGLSGKENTINLGDNKFEKVGVTSDSKIYLLDTILNENAGDSNNTTVTLKYNNELYKGNSILNNINAQAFDVSNFFSSDEAEREVQLDKIYSSNIYSETVKAAYDTVKMNEEAVLSLARKSEVGKWTAEGKALYSKDEYDRKGTVGEYSSEIESTGLMAAFGYGLNETTTAGVAFSGVKQDVDTDGGSADADLFYLGVYGNKVYGNYDFTAGLGYQFGEYEADNTITNVHSSDKYDSKALSGYVQGRYTADLGDGLSLQPRVRLGYTYVEQDDTRDSYFGVSDTEISTFDAEFGLDTVKSVQLEKSKVDVKFGVSYVRTMGDTDDEFTGRFYGATASEGFDVLGAELAENVVKFNLGAEVTNENGFFYNGGLTYEFGSDDTDAYGINVGVGYKF